MLDKVRNTTSADETTEFWKAIEGVQTGMMSIPDEGRLVPMSHYVDRGSNALWFITAEGTALVKAAAGSPQPTSYVIASGGDGIYAHLTGKVTIENNKAKLDELWSAIAASWFEDGKRDADVRLLKFSLSNAEAWMTNGSLASLYQIAKANITGDKPDIGEHVTLSF